GLSVGELTVDGDDVRGLAVIEASRLCDVAEGGQILASDLVRQLASTRAPLVFEPRGEQVLKGIPEPVTVAEVRWDLPRPTSPLPDGLAPGQFPLVGREANVAVLDGALTDVREGGVGLVVVTGEAGVGKSRLVADVARRSHETGAVVLYGRADEAVGA